MTRATRRHRRAFLLIETALATLLVIVAMTLTAGMLTWIVAERRSAERRGWAAQEAAIAMERFAILPYDDLTTKVAQASARLSDAARDALPDARMTAEVSDAGEGLARRVGPRTRMGEARQIARVLG